jgi:hypothetical protein
LEFCYLYRCSTEQIPFYQVRGLSKTIYLANMGSGPTTVVSFDDGITWNKTYYECDKVLKKTFFDFEIICCC